MLYLDTSAFLKLLVDEEHSSDLRAALAEDNVWSSSLLDVEAHRAGRRLGLPADVVTDHLDAVTIFMPGERTLAAAREHRPRDAAHPRRAAPRRGPGAGGRSRRRRHLRPTTRGGVHRRGMQRSGAGALRRLVGDVTVGSRMCSVIIRGRRGRRTVGDLAEVRAGATPLRYGRQRSGTRFSAERLIALVQYPWTTTLLPDGSRRKTVSPELFHTALRVLHQYRASAVSLPQPVNSVTDPPAPSTRLAKP